MRGDPEIVSSRQGDLLHSDEQADLFGEEAPTPEYRADPDAVWIKNGNGGGDWLGKIVGGRFHRFKACSDPQQYEIANICADPSSAARAFGQRWTTCSCCGRTLTNEQSRAAGIGPICAERWGL